MKRQPSYLLHETCDIVNFIMDYEPCVFAHVMDLDLLACVILHAAVLRRARIFVLHVLVLSSHWALSFFPHIHAVSVATLLDFSQLLPSSLELFLTHLTCPGQFLSSRRTIWPPVTRNYPIRSLEPNQPISARLCKLPETDPVTANQNQEQIITRPPNVTRMITHTSVSSYATPKVLNTFLFACVYYFVIGLMCLS